MARMNKFTSMFSLKSGAKNSIDILYNTGMESNSISVLMSQPIFKV